MRRTPNGAKNFFLFSFSAWLMALQQVQSSELKHTPHKAQDFRGWPKDVSAQGSVQRVEAQAPQGAELTTLVLARSESSRRSGQLRNCYLKNMKQEPRSTREASPQSGLDGGCKRCSRSRKLRGLSLHAQTRRTGISLSLTLPCVLPKEAGKPLGGGGERATHPKAAGTRTASYKAEKR